MLHDIDTSLIKQQREQEIMAQFEAGAHSVTAEARVLFRQGVTAVLALPPEAQQAWLIRIHQARVWFGQLQEERRHVFRTERRGLARWLRGTAR